MDIETIKFVRFIEEHLDVLSKSQTKEQKQKKSEAADKIVEKWKNVTGKTLNHGSLLKKINNLKSRAKTALSSGKPLSEWQTKILEICCVSYHLLSPLEPMENEICACFQATELVPDSNNEMLDATPKKVTTNDEEAGELSSTLDAKQILNKYEIDETKRLNNEQLQRLVHLKQVKVLSLQEQRLRRL